MECCETDPTDTPQTDEACADDRDSTDADWDWVRLAIGAFLGGNAMIVGLSINVSAMPARERLFVEIALLGSTVVVFELLGRRLLSKVREAISNREITFEFLFLSGILGALGISIASMIRGAGPVYFEVASLLLVVYAAGDKLGRISRRRGLERARSWAVDETTCRIRTDCGHTRTVPLEEVEVGDVVRVEPEETIPVDGTIVTGDGFVRDAHVTGESLSTVKRPGDRVWAGSDVLDASLAIETDAAKGERTIDAIRTSVEAAWAEPSEWQAEADRIVQWFFPFVMAATAATFAYWSWSGAWQEALFHSLSVLLIACPCALGFAVPLAVWMTLGRYADAGLVADGGDVVERLARCDVALFDKTGTLTDSAGRLVDVVGRSDVADRTTALALAHTLEQGSDHPVAAAFRGSLPVEIDDARWQLLESRSIPGAGIRGRVSDRETGETYEVVVGTEALVPEGESEAFEAAVDRLRGREGARRIAIVVDDRVAGAAAVAERPAETIDETLEALRDLDVRPMLVTGDRPERAEQLGFDEVYAEFKPDEKAELVRELTDDGHRVLVVGDGVNDASAMAEAEVAVASADGSELTLDVADATWHGFDPTDLATALERAREAVSLIHSNLGWAVVYNVVGIGAAAAGLLHPVFAAVLMVGSSLFVTWRTALSLNA